MGILQWKQAAKVLILHLSSQNPFKYSFLVHNYRIQEVKSTLGTFTREYTMLVKRIYKAVIC